MIRREVAAQKDRFLLWAPVFFGIGIGLYFLLRFEPPFLATGGIFAAGWALWILSWFLRGRNGAGPAIWLAATALFLVTAGFAGAQVRTQLLHTIMLEKPERVTMVEGTVDRLDLMEEGKGMRLILKDLAIEDMVPEKTPARARLLMRHPAELRPGDRVRVMAGLNPPSPPVAPGAFDFQRYAYFQGIGAFGFTFRAPEIVRKAESTSLEQGLEDIRQSIMARIRRHIPPAAAPIAIALVTGEMTAVSEADWDAMRISGLAHMLSISGMHIGLIATLLFFTSRFLMALWPSFALYHPIKKYAAVIAFAGALFYTLLAGAPIPAIRSLIMTGVVLFAVLVDRTPFSTRTIALAAMGILIFWPDAMSGASFQMSFAAMVALIVFCEEVGGRITAWHKDAGFLRRAFLYFGGVCASTLVASLATAPFSLYHFQQLGLYSIPSNMAASPVMAFIIMPAGLLACLLMPLGLEHWPLWVMGKGVDFVNFVAHETASWPQASLKVAAQPLTVLLLAVAGGIIFLLWRGWGRLSGLALVLAAVLVAWVSAPPDILVSPDVKLIALRDNAGKLTVSSRVRDKFSAENWLRRNGQDSEQAEKWPAEGYGEATGLTCAEEGCRMERDGRKVAFSFQPVAQAEDCHWADIMVASYAIRGDCPAATKADRIDMWKNGAYALWLDGRAESVTDVRGHRPWTISPRRK